MSSSRPLSTQSATTSAHGPDEAKELDRLVAAIGDAIGEDAFRNRFSTLVRFELTDGSLHVAVGTPYLLNYLRRTFGKQIQAVFHSLHGESAAVEWTHDPSLAAESIRPSKPTAVAVTKSPSSVDAPGVVSRFDQFEVGESNQTAWSIARGFAADPLAQRSHQAGERMAYIYGGHGLGKSHLVDAVGSEVKRTQRDVRVLSVTAWEFGNWLSDAIQTRTTPMFRSRFRGVDVLLIDNVDFFDGHRKESFQDGLLQTIDKLQTDGKAVFLTGLVHPKMMTKTSADLVSRLLAGNVARLAEPDEALRLQIAAAYAKRIGVTATRDALVYIASKFRRSVREIQGALNTLANELRAEEDLQRLSRPEVAGDLFDVVRKPTRRVGITLARKILGSLERESAVVVNLADIDRQVCDLFGIDRGDLHGKGRTRRVSRPRMVAMYLARRLTPAAYKEIGDHFGGRNHSTVMAAERTIKGLVGERATLQAGTADWVAGDLIAELEQRLLAG